MAVPAMTRFLVTHSWNGKCLFLFSSPHVSMQSTWLLWWNSREQSSFLWRKKTSNSELLLILLLELRTLKRHVSTNKNIHLQKKTHTYIQLLYWEELGLLCETLRISSSRVSSVDSFAVLKNRLIKEFFSDNVSGSGIFVVLLMSI